MFTHVSVPTEAAKHVMGMPDRAARGDLHRGTIPIPDKDRRTAPGRHWAPGCLTCHRTTPIPHTLDYRIRHEPTSRHPTRWCQPARRGRTGSRRQRRRLSRCRMSHKTLVQTADLLSEWVKMRSANVPNRGRSAIRASFHLVLIFSTLVAACGGESADPISVRYRVTFLGDVEMPARIRYESPSGTREITVDQLPWQSAWMKFDPHAAVAVVVRIPMTDPTGNLQCEVLTDEPGTTVQSVSTRRCEASGNLPFVRS